MQNTTPWSVGIDIGDRKCDVCVLDPSGEVIEESQIPTKPASMERLFRRLEPCRLAMEVGTHSSWIEEIGHAVGHEVYVANARKLRAIWDNDKKTDRTDARMLAEIVQLKPSLLRPIKQRGQEARINLKLVHARCALVRSRTDLVNHVRGTVKSFGSRFPTCDASVFHKTTDALPEEVKHILEPLLKHIGEVTALIRGYDKAIDAMAEAEPATKQLQQVKGVGALTALTFVLTVEDPNRFPQSRKIGSYLGLRPRLDESCTIKKQLRITKAGDKYLRSLLVGSAQHILGPFGADTDLRRWGLGLAQTGGKNAKKRAVVAVARKLSVLLLTLWKSGAVYEPLRQAKRRGLDVPAVGMVEVSPTIEAPNQPAIVEEEPRASRRSTMKRMATKTSVRKRTVKSIAKPAAAQRTTRCSRATSSPETVRVTHGSPASSTKRRKR